MKTVISRRTALRQTLGGLAAIMAVGTLGITRPVLAHEADCPVCSLPVVQDTETLDNEVTLKFGRKRIEYRCVYCALADAQKEYKGDVSILAPTEKKGTPVLLKRTGDKWTANLEKDGEWKVSENVVFIGHKVNHKHCQTGYRALTSRASFDQWVKANKEVVGDAKPLTLSQLLDISK